MSYKCTKRSLARVNTTLQWRNNGSCGQIWRVMFPISGVVWPSGVSALATLEQTLSCLCWVQRGVNYSLLWRGGGKNNLCMKCGPAVVQIMSGLPGPLDAGIQEWPSPLHTDSVHLWTPFMLLLFSLYYRVPHAAASWKVFPPCLGRAAALRMYNSLGGWESLWSSLKGLSLLMPF